MSTVTVTAMPYGNKHTPSGNIVKPAYFGMRIVKGAGSESQEFRKRLDAAVLAYQGRMGLRKFTQDDIADLVGVTQPTVSKWFRGRVPDKANGRTLAALLGVRWVWLEYGEGEMVADEIPVRSNRVSSTDAGKRRRKGEG